MAPQQERETAPEPKRSLRINAAFGLLRVMSYFEEKKRFADSRRDAQDYEKRAAEFTPGRIEHGRLLLSAGQAYLNARMTDKAVAVLETAQPDMEDYKKQGTQYGFLGLERFYHTLGAAYRLSGRTEEHEAMLEKARELAVEMETAIGLSVRFAPNGDQLVSSVPAAETI